jgi:hypothetical protein
MVIACRRRHAVQGEARRLGRMEHAGGATPRAGGAGKEIGGGCSRDREAWSACRDRVGVDPQVWFGGEG